MNSFAIIPAKGRSTRLPGKNAKLLFGVPMVQRVINVLIQSDCFEEIWVSTDSPEIAAISKRSGAKVHHRSPELCEDTSTVNQVILDWLDSLKNRPDSFCCVYPTAVFLQSENISGAKDKLVGETDCVMGVSKFNYPPVQAMHYDEVGSLRMLMPEYMSIQSQQYPECFVSNGSQYWAKTTAFLREKTFYMKNLVGYETDPNRILDINDSTDFEIAIERARLLGWTDEFNTLQD